MSTAAVLFASTFVVVLALGLQSLNVNGGHRWMAAITSIAISASNLVLLKVMPGPTDGLQIAAYMLGGPVGIVVAMALHPRLVAWLKREPKKQAYVGHEPPRPMPPPAVQPWQAQHAEPADPLKQLALDLLDPDALGWQVSPEIRKRAASALNP